MKRDYFRVLSMWQPWATLAVAPRADGLPAKRYETRAFSPMRYVRDIPLPIPVAVHATKRKTELNELYESRGHTYGAALRNALRDVGYTVAYPPPLGAIIGVGEIVQVYHTETVLAQMNRDVRGDLELAMGDYSAGRYAWQLANVVKLAQPVPFRGRQQPLYKLDAPTLDAVWAQL